MTAEAIADVLIQCAEAGQALRPLTETEQAIEKVVFSGASMVTALPGRDVEFFGNPPKL